MGNILALAIDFQPTFMENIAGAARAGLFARQAMLQQELQGLDVSTLPILFSHDRAKGFHALPAPSTTPADLANYFAPDHPVFARVNAFEALAQIYSPDYAAKLGLDAQLSATKRLPVAYLKAAAGAFGLEAGAREGEELSDFLRRQGYSRLLLSGGNLMGCVLQTALGALQQGFEVAISLPQTFGIDGPWQRRNPRQCEVIAKAAQPATIDLLETPAALQAWLGRASRPMRLNAPVIGCDLFQ